jgi:ATP-dependent RNA helicase HelY
MSGFWASVPFEPDPFQLQAVEAIEAGRTVVVTAPTGAGKTLIAEAAVHLALARGRRAFYTTPLKALSNQKFVDFVERLSVDRVGLLTGDNVINGDAPLVVMTTEVLRNMIYAGKAALQDLDVVVLDEVHYLQDPFRGAVWEEIIIHAPRSVQIVALSATVSNADVLAEWVEERRGPTVMIRETRRPVPLESRYLIKDRFRSGELLLFSMFSKEGKRPNPEVSRLLANRRGRRRRFATPRRTETCRKLARDGMLPAIYFIFSRAGCEAAAHEVVEGGLNLMSPDERGVIAEIAERQTSSLSDEELRVLGYAGWVRDLAAGVAPHHAGMVPAFKETVEELFTQGLVKLVFATETLSLGINMPAKTVVLESMTKFTGEAHEPLMPGDYTQLTGRAGRRGIDTRGYGVTLHSPYMAFDRVAGIAAAGSHPIRSSFRPTYNMAVNLIANYSPAEAERLLNASLAQFQRRRSVRRLRKSVDRVTKELEEVRKAADCEHGDIWEYLEATRRGGNGRTARRQFGRRLRQGSVVSIPDGPTEGRRVVLQRWGTDDTRLLVVSDDGELTRIRVRDLPVGTVHLGRMSLPAPYRPRSPGYRARVAQLLAEFQPSERLELKAGGEVLHHPVHTCPRRGDHLRAAERVRVLERELERQRHRLGQSSGGIVEEFRRIRALLEGWSYTVGWSLTSRGEELRFLYSELDLLVVESMRRGLMEELEPTELAAFCSAFVYQPRAQGPRPRWPTERLEKVGARLVGLAEELGATESHHGLPRTRPPDPGIAELIYRWGQGAALEDLLAAGDLAAGDFVRTCRQLIDLLRQIRDVAADMAGAAGAAIDLIDRSVVAAPGVL